MRIRTKHPYTCLKRETLLLLLLFLSSNRKSPYVKLIEDEGVFCSIGSTHTKTKHNKKTKDSQVSYGKAISF